MPSPAVEDYVKAIYKLSRGDSAASTSAIAERLGVAAGSVTGMLKRLAELGLVEHVPYYGARLTASGANEAVRMIRRHRILELFLVEVLGYTWDRVHEEAERLEHAASDELIARMAQVLGEPECDPHGAPIPNAGESFQDFEEVEFPGLDELEVGQSGILRRVSDEDPAALRYLAGLGLKPGVQIEVLERAPFNGPLRLRVGNDEQFIGRELSRYLRVEPDDPGATRDRSGS
ncbi:MAG TPA: metal-dependent transcriptional regulator [Longimicrobiales bacterium]|nr:metal-dependent transcriptional regulator [Longimicrobiales bacterium]